MLIGLNAGWRLIFKCGGEMMSQLWAAVLHDSSLRLWRFSDFERSKGKTVFYFCFYGSRQTSCHTMTDYWSDLKFILPTQFVLISNFYLDILAISVFHIVLISLFWDYVSHVLVIMRLTVYLICLRINRLCNFDLDWLDCM